jgi:hypothetical protein
MIESYQNAIEEFKRVDHLYHVSLKYTRTVDVIRSVIERMISTYENAIDAFLKCLKEEKKIDDLPGNPVGKGDLAKNKVENDEMRRYLDNYLKMRKILRCEYNKRDEFRRHVTMIVNYEGETLNIDIDKLKEYYDETKNFLMYVRNRVQVYRVDE